MIKLRKLSLMLAFAAMSTMAHASQTDKGATSQILTVNNDAAFFEQSAGRSGRPACATLTRWVIGITTPSDQVILAHLLSMNAQHRKVYVTGTGTCAMWADSETVAGLIDAD